MTQRDDPGVEKTVGDLLDATNAAAELVGRGRQAWDRDRLLRLAGEAIINRIGDSAARLPDNVRSEMPAVPWDAIRANRVLVAHIYHRIDYSILWETLRSDLPQLAAELNRWIAHQRSLGRAIDPITREGRGPEIGR